MTMRVSMQVDFIYEPIRESQVALKTMVNLMEKIKHKIRE